MEYARKQVESVERVIAEVVQSQLQTLNDAQLALVGGGIGETVAL